MSKEKGYRETVLSAHLPNTPEVRQVLAEVYRAGMVSALDAVAADMCAEGSPQAAMLAAIRKRLMASEIRVFQR